MSRSAALYPTQLEGDVVMRNGSVAHIRPIRATDEPSLLSFLQSLPDDDRRMRLFGPGNDLGRVAHDESDVDYVQSLALVVTVQPEQCIIGHGMYVVSGESRAEVAFAIRPAYQGEGLATLLLGQLADAATQHDIHTFEAVVSSGNRRMLEVLRESGFPVETHHVYDTIELSFPTSLTPEALDRFQHREEVSAANALRRVLYPQAIALIGASERRGAVGTAVLRNLLAAGFPGPVYPVNPRAGTIQSLRAFGSVEDIDGLLDLAIIAVPAAHVLEVAEQCGRKGVRALIVLTAGFGEVGAEGQRRQADLLRICRAYGMRMIGPNCIGAINTDPGATLNATFGPLMPPLGKSAWPRRAARLAWLPSISRPRVGLAFPAWCRWATKQISLVTTCSATGRQTLEPK
jgi:predicted CoA-binding protein/RimJ/RimL family protein N-acetyltransferase